MTNTCRLRIAREDYDALWRHLFSDDSDEHGAVLLAGTSSTKEQLTLCVREVHIARDGTDYVEGKIGYRALAPTFIHKLITRARDQRLVYLAAHNHASDRDVAFSHIDLESHERGYPALLQIAKGMPVGGMVLGKRSMQMDLWLPSGQRMELEYATVVGNTVHRLTPAPRRPSIQTLDMHDRQVRMFGPTGQMELSRCRIAIIGLGGIGSLVAEYLARLGVGQFCLIDPDQVETSNLSRIVGASQEDAAKSALKVTVAERVVHQANPQARVQVIADDVAKETVAKSLTSCDYIFLAADSMRARLVVNAVVHQYLIPSVQLGSKIRSATDGTLVEIMSANRPLRPGHGCLLCNELIDATQLAKEAKTDDERKAQAYGVEEPNPSVVSLNAVSAAHAVNDFLLDYLGIRPETDQLFYEHFYFLKRQRSLVQPRKDPTCSDCSHDGLRFGRGDGVTLPCIEG